MEPKRCYNLGKWKEVMSNMENQFNNYNQNPTSLNNMPQYNQAPVDNYTAPNNKENKPSKSNSALIVILLVIVLSFAGYIVYDKFMAEEPNDVNNNEIPNEPEKKEVTATYCYENKLVGAPGISAECSRQNPNDCVTTNTIYNKQVIRLSGDSEGVKNFNKKLEKLVTDYAWDTDTKEYADYTCNPITKANLITGVTFDYSDEIYQLSDKYIIIRIDIDQENLSFAGGTTGLHEIFIFDIENDKEITKQAFVQTLKNKYNVSIKMSCGDQVLANYTLKDENNQDIAASTLASRINKAFNTSYDGEKLKELFLDMYYDVTSTDYIYETFKNGETTGDFYQMYLESKCSEDESM